LEIIIINGSGSEAGEHNEYEGSLTDRIEDVQSIQQIVDEPFHVI
jgi:hypothetical protein